MHKAVAIFQIRCLRFMPLFRRMSLSQNRYTLLGDML